MSTRFADKSRQPQRDLGNGVIEYTGNNLNDPDPKGVNAETTTTKKSTKKSTASKETEAGGANPESTSGSVSPSGTVTDSGADPGSSSAKGVTTVTATGFTTSGGSNGTD